MNDQRKQVMAKIGLVLGASLLANTALARDTKTEFEVNAAETALVIVNSPSECGDGAPGCKEAKFGKNMKLKMRLVGDDNCSRPGGKRWELQSVYLGGYNHSYKPAGSGGLPALVGNDFDVDTATGLINPQAAGSNKIDFYNHNRAEYDVWYRVTAVCMSNAGEQVGAPIESDPRIRNRGGGTG